MDDNKEMKVASLNPASPTERTESGELERPVLRRHRIDCGGNPEIADRQDIRRGGQNSARRHTDLPAAS
jgi:hypothetical protein